jgi:hypothetical protein
MTIQLQRKFRKKRKKRGITNNLPDPVIEKP